MKWPLIQEALLSQGLSLFSAVEFRRACRLSPASAKFVLIRYVKAGLILRLKARRGLYALKEPMPDPWMVANRLMRPSYISLATALSHHGVIPETVYEVTSVSPKSTRTFRAMGQTFTFKKIKAPAFGGYGPVSRQGRAVLVAEPEKALADAYYLAHRGKGPWPERVRWEALDRKRLLTQVALFESAPLLNRVRKEMA